MKELTKKVPLAYFITFTCYGTWLHGEKAIGSVDRHTNKFGASLLSEDHFRQAQEEQLMHCPEYFLDCKRRKIVLASIVEASDAHQWKLFAAHIRTNHVHVVVEAFREAEFVMNCFKSYASRYLNAAKIDGYSCKRWTRHGSTRYLWKEGNVLAAVDYVLHQQGEPMAVFAGI